MTTHVFIVNESSFPIHLEYLFAGTGAADANDHIGLLSDIKRVRIGDRVIFYLETKESSGIDGGFFGIFKIANINPIVIQDSGNPTYLEQQLGKKLIYRVRIDPADVYSKGVVEYQALDNLPVYAKEILWSLIYRKLKGQRGCTPLTIEESDRLIDMIQRANNNRPLRYNNSDGFTYNASSQEIKVVSNGRKRYAGATNPATPILPQILKLANSSRAFEIHLQAYFTENSGLNVNQTLDTITDPASQIIWLGNEVKCGVGMRSIDIFSIINLPRNIRQYKIMELKDEQVTPTITRQIFKYINWTSQYINGAINANIQPIVVAREIPNSGNNRLRRKKLDSNGNPTTFWQEIRDAFNVFNAKNLAMPILYYEYNFVRNNIVFTQVRY
ncbi:hypothetical protein HY768_06510 [candidate division TA06 bacterium]|uniref:EVE domain-containing protein n=1 Tax=candidate division TA06 bacterium TaxID=2250710 RepID=A0A933MKX2_UNCT6|nr:hypothetical protein [candidate division TA06 bacterium]